MAKQAVHRIAAARQVNAADARSFCESVQRYFHGKVPAFDVIAEQTCAMPHASAKEIAIRLGAPADAEPRPLKPQKTRRKKVSRPSNRLSRFWEAENGFPQDDEPRYTSWGSGYRNPLRSSNRLEPAKAAHCPHGIPFYKTCAICDRERFHEQTGL